MVIIYNNDNWVLVGVYYYINLLKEESIKGYRFLIWIKFINKLSFLWNLLYFIFIVNSYIVFVLFKEK